MVRTMIVVVLMLAGLLGTAGLAAAQPAPITCNNLRFLGAATGSNPSIVASGCDTNVGITFTVKGAGTITLAGSVEAAVTKTSQTASFQPVAGDLTLAGTGIGKAGGYQAGVMGGVLGASGITAATDGAQTFGVIGKFAIAGTSYDSTYLMGGVLGEASGTSDCAVCAVVSDSTFNVATTIGAYFGVDQQFDMSASKVNFGADLQATSHGGYIAKVPDLCEIRLGSDVCLKVGAGAPVDGVSGTCAGTCGPGSLYLRTGNGTLFQNTNTTASPTWTAR